LNAGEMNIYGEAHGWMTPLISRCQSGNARAESMNKKHPYKDSDVRRVVKSCLKAGVAVASVRVNPTTGEITGSAFKEGAAAANAWDGVLTHAEEAERPAEALHPRGRPPRQAQSEVSPPKRVAVPHRHPVVGGLHAPVRAGAGEGDQPPRRSRRK